jgi:hypothetical protein
MAKITSNDEATESFFKGFTQHLHGLIRLVCSERRILQTHENTLMDERCKTAANRAAYPGAHI